MRTIKYSVTDKEHEIIRRCAAVKGNTPSSMSKHAVFQFVSRFPPKGIFEDNYEPAPKVAPRAKPVQVNGNKDTSVITCERCGDVSYATCPNCGFDLTH